MRFFPLYLANFLSYVGYAMGLPLFGAMFLDKEHPILPPGTSLGDRTTLLGLLLCAYPLGQFFGAPIIGAFSDHFGRRPLLLFSMSCTATLYTVAGLSIHFAFLPLLFCTLFVAGLLEGSIGIAQSFIADQTTGHERTVCFGRNYSSGALGFIAGSIMTAQLSSISYTLPFYVLSGLLILALPVVATMMKPMARVRPERIELKKALTSFRILFSHKVLRWTFSISFLFYMTAFGSLTAFVIFATSTYNLPANKIAYFITFLASLIFATTILVVPRLPRGRTTYRTAATAAIMLGIFMALLPLVPSLGVLWLFLLPQPFAVGICLTETTTMISTKALDGELGRVMGANQALLGLSRAVAASAAGLLAAIALPLPLLVLGGVGILAGILLILRQG